MNTLSEHEVEINQIWSGTTPEGEVIRRIRILARHPDDINGKPAWIFEELAGGRMKTEIGRLGICPEFNLRYVFEVEDV